ncbi:hypothetical protein MBLNU457_5899t1 [Dothideomycetes sp. NU457]
MPDLFDQRVLQDYLSRVDRRQVTPPALIVAGVGIIYATWSLARYLGFLSPIEILWNILVYIVPVRLVVILAKWKGSGDAEARMRSGGTSGEIHAMKGEALRNLFALSNPLSKAPLELRTLGPTRLLQTAATKSDVPPGLGNWDNSCYQNSVLQGLSTLRSFTEFLGRANDTGSTTGSLHALTSSLNDHNNNGRRIWTPAKLKSMSSWQQQDAQEYFSKILDEVDKEMVKSAAAKTTPHEGLSTLARIDRNAGSKESDHDVGEADKVATVEEAETVQGTKPGSFSVAQGNPLEGLLAQRVTCVKCGFSEGLSLLPFNCLTVPLGRARSYNIEDCLDEYSNLEEISGVECASCTLKQSEAKLARMVESTAEQAKQASILSLPPELRQQIVERLQTVRQAIDDADFSDNTIYKKCLISKDGRVSSTKTRQAVVARPPKALVIHINRSLFDEYTGAQSKNYADVRYPAILDLRPWCLGKVQPPDKDSEHWSMRPTESMIPGRFGKFNQDGPFYQLRAVVTHYGRHENGHYICYRQHVAPTQSEQDGESTKPQWWRLSDEDVSAVTQETVLSQSGAFMLFYERIKSSGPIEFPPVKGVPELRDQQQQQEAEVVTPDDEAQSSSEAPSPLEQPAEISPGVTSDEGPATVSADIQEEAPKPHQAKNEPQPRRSTPSIMRTSRAGSKKNKNGFLNGPRQVTA